MKLFLLSRTLCASALVLGLLGGGIARADSVLGSIYENDTMGAQNATPGNVPSRTADVTFSVNGPFNFASNNSYTIGQFLSSGGATVLTGINQLNNTLSETLFNFEGFVTVTHGETFTVGHDDGITLVIGGVTVINDPGGTTFHATTETYMGPTGTFAFQLVYGESYGEPGDLTVSLPFTEAAR